MNNESDDSPEERQSPIANAKPRMKSMMDDIGRGILDIRPFVPKSFTLFHGIANVLAMIQSFQSREQSSRVEKEQDQHSPFVMPSVPKSLIEQLSSFPGAAKAGLTPSILKAMSPESLKGMASQLGLPSTLAASASDLPSSSARPPGPASAVVTPPYAGVLAGGGISQGGGNNSGGSELRDILGVLRDILDAIRQLKTQGGEDEDDDESESVENRKPPFKKVINEIKPSENSGSQPPPSVSVPAILRPQQQDASGILGVMRTIVELAR